MNELSTSHELIFFAHYCGTINLFWLWMAGRELEGGFEVSDCVLVFRTVLQFLEISLQVNMYVLDVGIASSVKMAEIAP